MKENAEALMPERDDDDAGILREMSELIRDDMLRSPRLLDAEEESNEI